MQQGRSPLQGGAVRSQNSGRHGSLQPHSPVEDVHGNLVDRQGERGNSNSNSKTLFYKDCSLGSVKYLSNTHSLSY